VTLSFIFAAYSLGSIATTFFVTTLTFGFMFVFGWVTKKDLTSMGSLLIMGVFGLIIASVANMFFASEILYWLVTYVGVLIFVGLIAYDAQKIKKMAGMGHAESDVQQKNAILGALALYLDFINLFILLLRIFGGRE
jgi:FtsH-binding integral membrane protein